MASSRKKYDELNTGQMTEAQARQALRDEVNSVSPRADVVTRLTGRINRERGRRVMRGVLALLSKKGEKNVDAVLDSHG